MGAGGMGGGRGKGRGRGVRGGGVFPESSINGQVLKRSRTPKYEL